MVRFDIWLFNLFCVALILATTCGEAAPTPALALAPGPTNANPDDSTIRFAVIGDFGSDNADELRVANLVSSWNLDFVITTGDNNYPDGAASTIDETIGQYYSQFIGNYQGSYGPGSSTNRFWPSLGNHDWHTITCTGGSCSGAYFDYFTLPNNERYYEVDLGLVHLFAIDSDGDEPDGVNENSVQANWLQNQLAASTSCYNLVYFHHAPYSSGWHGSNSTMQWPFSTWGADAVFSGHDHQYERLDVNGTPYFVNGAGGAKLYSFDNIGNLPPEAESIVRYNQDHGAMLVTASFTGITYQFYNGGNTLIDEYTVPKNCDGNTFADLRLSKTGVGGNAVAGSTHDYILTVTNDGPSNSSGGTVSDTLPAGWTFSSATGGDCNSTNGGFTCTVDPLTVGASKSFNATVNVPANAQAGTTVTNTATVFGNEDTNSSNDTDSATTTITTPADLRLSKTGVGDSAVAGSTHDYILTVTNDGPSHSSGGIISDTLPVGWSFSSDANGDCNSTPSGFTCTVGALADGASQSFVATVNVPADAQAGTTATNSATVFGNEDTNSNNDTDSATTTITTSADLRLSKTGVGGIVVAGSTHDYILTVTNDGPSNSSGGTVSDTLPAGWTFSSATGGDCNSTNGGFTCTVDPLTVGASKSFNATVNVPANAQAGTTVTNTATVFGNEDTNSSNDTDSATTTITTSADLSILKQGQPDPVIAGERLTYTLTIQNNGPSIATGVVVTDDLPSGVNLVSAISSAGNCSGTDPVICNIGGMNVSTNVTVTIVVDVDTFMFSLLVNNATVSGDQSDGDLFNNLATRQTGVNRLGQLLLFINDNPDVVTAGTNLTYTISITNSGPSGAANVVMTDTLPPEVDFVSIRTGPGDKCIESLGVLDCIFGDLAVDESASIEILVFVHPSTFFGQIANKAVVSGDAITPSMAIETTDVVPVADLRLSKTGVGGSAVAGSTHDYILTVTNGGPSNSSGGSFSDTLPAGWSFSSDTGSDCTSTAGGFECVVGPLAVGASQSFTATVNVPAGAPAGPTMNWAVVSGNEDLNPANDNDGATTTIIATSDPVFIPITMKSSISPSFILSNRANNSSFEGMSLIERP